MNDILEQNDIDALLAAVDSGEIEEETQNGQLFSRQRRDLEEVEIRSYDFKRPERVSKEQMRALQTLHESFARILGAALSGFLRTIIEIKVASAEQMTYAEFIAGLPNPTSFSLLTADPLEGQMCLEISPLIVYPLIDRMLGGGNQDLFIPQRPMTAIEVQLIGIVVQRATDALKECWEGIKDVDFALSEMESNPHLVQIVPPNEVVIVMGFEIKMSSRAGTMNLCIPFNVIEPLIEELSNQSWFNVQRSKDQDVYASMVSESLAPAYVKLSGILANTTMTLDDLRHLAVGDVLMTDKNAARPVIVSVEGQQKFVAQIGQYRGGRALQVVRRIHKDDRI